MSGYSLEMKELASACCSDESGFNVLKPSYKSSETST